MRHQITGQPVIFVGEIPPSYDSPLPAPAPQHYISTTGGLIVRHTHAGDALVAVRPFRSGDLVFAFTHVTWRPWRDDLTVEDPRGRHIYDPLLARIAHGCDPNCRVDFDLMALIARRGIAAGDTLTIDYLATETAICAPFSCHCGAADCRGRIERDARTAA